MTRIDSMLQTLLYWAVELAHTQITLVGTHALELLKPIRSCPEIVRLTQQHPLVACTDKSTERFRKVFGHAILEIQNADTETKKTKQN